MLSRIKNLVVEEKGQGMTEYGLLLGVVVVAVVAALALFKTQLESLFTTVTTRISNAIASL